MCSVQYHLNVFLKHINNSVYFMDIFTYTGSINTWIGYVKEAPASKKKA